MNVPKTTCLVLSLLICFIKPGQAKESLPKPANAEQVRAQSVVNTFLNVCVSREGRPELSRSFIKVTDDRSPLAITPEKSNHLLWAQQVEVDQIAFAMQNQGLCAAYAVKADRDFAQRLLQYWLPFKNNHFAVEMMPPQKQDGILAATVYKITKNHLPYVEWSMTDTKNDPERLYELVIVATGK